MNYSDLIRFAKKHRYYNLHLHNSTKVLSSSLDTPASFGISLFKFFGARNSNSDAVDNIKVSNIDTITALEHIDQLQQMIVLKKIGVSLNKLLTEFDVMRID